MLSAIRPGAVFTRPSPSLSSREPAPPDSVSLSSQRPSRNNFWQRNILSLALFAVLGIGIGMHQIGVAIHAQNPIPPGHVSEERELAEGETCVRRNFFPVQDTVELDRVARMASRLEPYGTRGPYDVRLTHSHTKNALACSDRTLLVERNLSQALDDEELLFVGAHELGHVELRHTAARLWYQDQAPWIIHVPIMNGPYIADFQALSQAGEKSADCFAVGVLRTEGIPVEKAESALRKTIGDAPQHGSHPPLAERLENLRQC